MLSVSRLGVTIKRKTIIHDVSFRVGDGRVCALIGPNGAGKSTLVKAVSGILPPTSGSVRINGAPLEITNRRALARSLAYLPQNTTPVPCSVFDAVLLGRKPYVQWRPAAEDRRLARDVLEEMRLLDLTNACVTRVSGGEFQKILIARTLVQGSQVLILDEPINHLDIRNQIEIMELIATLTRARGLSTIIVLHDLNLALRYADSVLLIREGRMLFRGSSRDVSPQDLSKAYDIPISIREVEQTRHVLY
ncbi:MAG: ABC transporter ATP-binding protein [Desulfovibrio sp.]